MDDSISVLLIDDQSIIGEAVRRMLAAENDIVFHYCSDPTQALKVAKIVPVITHPSAALPSLAISLSDDTL